nr:MAG TPA: hypothetical protein [Caudoviricetes sp.]
MGYFRIAHKYILVLVIVAIVLMLQQLMLR